ncbi:PREDICTED: protein PET100 homolog, mitochondrial [Dinoponera quadriceps]|uniref:Protein PET100 homolog, mitochondrial n=1 Tax=Dinoponera quadriceps TaxID=609295 RepID=A0A6P3XHF1_DINQU|nr:PREDICTED: protein PET100 homolog, mitochondrial [Dinoponera quadriceps]
MDWKFEIFKMFMYISFPVGIFHYFNQPENFEEMVIKAKKEYFPPQSRQKFEEMDKFIYNYNAKVEKNRLEEMERQYEKKP